LPEIPGQQSSEGESAGFNNIRKTFGLLRKPSPVLAMGTLLSLIGALSAKSEEDRISEQICRRFKFSNEETRQIVDIASSYASLVEPGDLAKSVWMRILQKPGIDDHLESLRVRLLGSGKSTARYAHWRQKLKEYRSLPEIRPLVNGEDLTQLGHSPGPLYKEILRTIEDLQLEDVLKTREDALLYIREHYPVTNQS
jgi:poly(A) polymerase